MAPPPPSALQRPESELGSATDELQQMSSNSTASHAPRAAPRTRADPPPELSHISVITALSANPEGSAPQAKPRAGRNILLDLCTTAVRPGGHPQGWPPGDDDRGALASLHTSGT